MQLRGYALLTHAQYIRTAEEFLALIGKNAAKITEQDVRAYGLMLLESDPARSTVNQKESLIRFFIGYTLNRPMNYLQMPKMKEPVTIPRTRSCPEALELINGCQNPKNKAVFVLAYGSVCAFPRSAALTCVISSPSECRFSFPAEKGGKDRYTLLVPNELCILHEYWKAERPNSTGPLFPGKGQNGTLTLSAAEAAMGRTVKAAGLPEEIYLHTLRLQLLSESPLSEVSGLRQRNVDRRAASESSRCSLLSRCLHDSS